MQRIALCLGLTMLGIASFAQQTVVKGKISDRSGEPIPFAYIIDLQGENGVTSSEDGSFTLPLGPLEGSARIQIRHASYADTILTLSQQMLEQADYSFDIRLKNRQLDEFVVEEQRKEKSTLQRLDAKAIPTVPTASGDFLNAALSTQMGVSMNNELSASYSVRGGSYDENLIYVNGIQIYRPFLIRAGEQEGLSFINSNMVEEIQFSAGGFPARYGDKMASVLDIRYKEPRRFGGGVNLSLLGGGIHLENAWMGGKLTQVTGIRYQSNQYILNSLDTEGEYKPRFSDLQSYWSYQVSNRSKISVLGQYSSNLYRFIPATRETEFGGIQQALRLTIFFDGQELSRYNSGMGTMQWQYDLSNAVRLNTYASFYATREEEEFDIVGQYFLDEIDKDQDSEEFGEVVQNLGIGGFLNHARNRFNGQVYVGGTQMVWRKPLQTVRAGVRYSYEDLDDRINEWIYIDSADFSLPDVPDEVRVFDRLRANNRIPNTRITGYVEGERVWYNSQDDEWRLNIGARAFHHSFTEQSAVSPRGYIAYVPKWSKQVNDSTIMKKELVLRLAGGLYYQAPFYREIRNFRGVVDPAIQAQRSTHLVLGADYPLFIWGRPFRLKAEAYYKWFDNLIPYELENIRIRYYGTNNATGFARGLDFKLNGEFIPGTESWATVSFMDTREDLSDDAYVTRFNASGEPIGTFTQDREAVDSTITRPGFIPRPTDQRFQIGIFFRDEMPNDPTLKVQLSLIYGTGLPYGPPSFERYKDTLRTRSYRRVDIGFSKELITDKNRGKGLLSPFNNARLSVEVFNLLQINNVLNYQWVRDVNGIQYSVPNFLTSRRVNVRFTAYF